MKKLSPEEMLARAEAEIGHARNQEEIEKLRITYLGRQGLVNRLLRQINQLPPDQRSERGRQINLRKKQIQMAISSQSKRLQQKRWDNLEQEWLDVSKPGLKPEIGHLHPQTHILQTVVETFKSLGYQVAMGPEIETDNYNFTKLNFPPEHPARDTQDTLYLQDERDPGSIMLRTQTSAMQGRIMEQTQPPLRVIVPGKCYRQETVDASHGFEFWQVEGFAVEESATMDHLLSTLETSLKLILGAKTKVRFACTYFPFVEPGVDTYVDCSLCDGKGCSYCKQSGWVEIMPAGMIHPEVFKAVGYDPKNVHGFAFAIGLSRLANLRYQIKDLRLLSKPDLRILKQF